jgi:hypothetical protein
LDFSLLWDFLPAFMPMYDSFFLFVHLSLPSLSRCIYTCFIIPFYILFLHSFCFSLCLVSVFLLLCISIQMTLCILWVSVHICETCFSRLLKDFSLTYTFCRLTYVSGMLKKASRSFSLYFSLTS